MHNSRKTTNGTMKKMALALVAAGALGTGCAPAMEDSVSAVGVSAAALSLAAGPIQFANGVYQGCSHRSGAWSLAVDGYSGQMDHDPLSVIKNDTACNLILTELKADELYTGDPNIPLGTSFRNAPSAFALEPGVSPIRFYANAKVSSLSFAAAFSVSVSYSDDPSRTDDENTADFTVVSASATSNNVPAPDYGIDLSGISIQTDVADVITAQTGAGQLSDGDQTGEAYLVLDSDPGSSYAQLDQAFNAGVEDQVPIEDANPSIPVEAFTLTDLTGSVTRYIIIQHVDAASSVPSYELITITFHPHA